MDCSQILFECRPSVQPLWATCSTASLSSWRSCITSCIIIRSTAKGSKHSMSFCVHILFYKKFSKFLANLSWELLQITLMTLKWPCNPLEWRKKVWRDTDHQISASRARNTPPECLHRTKQYIWLQDLISSCRYCTYNTTDQFRVEQQRHMKKWPATICCRNSKVLRMFFFL